MRRRHTPRTVVVLHDNALIVKRGNRTSRIPLEEGEDAARHLLQRLHLQGRIKLLSAPRSMKESMLVR